MANNNKDKSRMFIRIIAAILATILVVAFAGTLIYYLFY